MLIACRDTPHPTTGITPYEAVQNRPVRTRLDYEHAYTTRRETDQEVDERDKAYKKKMTQEKRNVKENKFSRGDYVSLKQTKIDKWSTAFEPAFYIITKIQGSSVTIKHIEDGRKLCRDASQLKLVNTLIKTRKFNPTQTLEEEEKSTADRETDEEGPEPEKNIENAGTEEDQGDIPKEVIGRPRRERQLPARLRDYMLS